MLTEVDDADLGPVLQHNVLWRMCRDPGPDPLHRPRGSAPTPTRCSRELGSTDDEIDQLREEGSRSDDRRPAGRRGPRPRRPRPRPAATASGCRSRPTTRSSGTRCRAGTATWSAPTAASAANDMITMGTHVGTHIDALAHVSHDGRLHGGADAAARPAAADGSTSTASTPSRRWSAAASCSTSPATSASTRLEGGYEITVDDLEATGAAARASTLGEGDVVLVRSGWGRRFDEGAAYVGRRDRRARRGRGRRPLARRARRARRRRRHHRLRAARPGRRPLAAAGPPDAAGRARHLHRRGDGPRAARRRRRAEFPFVLVPAQPLSARPARRCGRWR